jgi:hypothetical protein
MVDYEEEGFKFARKRFEDGRKQGAVEGEIKGYKNVIFCLEKENKRFKKKINPYINNSELEQFTREQIQEIENFIKELEEGVK